MNPPESILFWKGLLNESYCSLSFFLQPHLRLIKLIIARLNSSIMSVKFYYIPKFATSAITRHLRNKSTLWGAPFLHGVQLIVQLTNKPRTFGFRLKIRLPTRVDLAEHCILLQLNSHLQYDGKMRFSQTEFFEEQQSFWKSEAPMLFRPGSPSVPFPTGIHALDSWRWLSVVVSWTPLCHGIASLAK